MNVDKEKEYQKIIEDLMDLCNRLLDELDLLGSGYVKWNEKQFNEIEERYNKLKENK